MPVIDFRYHVVSIVAVFLALTVGLVIGSSYLSKVAYDNLNGQLADLRGENQALHANQTQLQAQIKDRNSLITALGPDAVAGKLAGQSVAVVVLPGADRAVGDDTAAMLVKAGATVTGEMFVNSALVDPGQRSKVATVADNAALAWSSFGVTGNGVATAITAAAPVRAFADLATAIGRKAPASTGTTTPVKVTDTQALAVLALYTNAGFIETKSTFASPADLVVEIAPSAPSSSGAATDLVNGYYLGFARDLGPLKGTVIAGPASSANSPGLIAAALKDAWTAKNVSTADSVDLPAGRIITVFALAEEELTQKTGHYGLTGTADGPLPALG